MTEFPIDYLEKYRPMLRLLEDYHEDLEYLASQTGYLKNHGRRYRTTVLDVLQGYVSELNSDYDILSSLAAEQALKNPELAYQVVRTRKAFKSCMRYIRCRMLLDQFLPTPGAGSAHDLVRKALIKLLPRHAVPYKLLAHMNTLRFIILAR